MKIPFIRKKKEQMQEQPASASGQTQDAEASSGAKNADGFTKLMRGVKRTLGIGVALNGGFAYATTFSGATGWAGTAFGAAKSLGIGMAMTVGALISIPFMLAGAMCGGILGDKVYRKNPGRGFLEGAIIGGAVFGMAALAGGEYLGYRAAKSLLVDDKTTTGSFNAAAAAPAKAPEKTITLTPESFQKRPGLAGN